MNNNNNELWQSLLVLKATLSKSVCQSAKISVQLSRQLIQTIRIYIATNVGTFLFLLTHRLWKHLYGLSFFLFLAVSLMSEPEECLMGPPGCDDSLGGWALGMTGQCFTPQAGFRIGKNAPSMISLQVLFCVLTTIQFPRESNWNRLFSFLVVRLDSNSGGAGEYCCTL